MSVEINQDGNMVITSDLNHEYYFNRLQSLVSIIQMKNADFTDDDTVWHMLEILNDYLPNEEQCAKMFEPMSNVGDQEEMQSIRELKKGAPNFKERLHALMHEYGHLNIDIKTAEPLNASEATK